MDDHAAPPTSFEATPLSAELPPPDPDAKRIIALRVDPQMDEDLKSIAKKDGTSVSAIIRNAIQRFILDVYKTRSSMVATGGGVSINAAEEEE